MRGLRRPPRTRPAAGAVLLLVLLVVTSLSLIVTMGLRGLGVEEAGARTLRNRLRGEALAESGLRLAAYWLAREAGGQGVTHYGQAPFQAFKHVAGRRALLDPDTTAGATILGLLADEKLHVDIQDESGKLPINALAGANFAVYKNVLLALLRNDPFRLPEDEALRLIYAVRDWLDADDTPFSTNGLTVGAEEASYAHRQARYRCKNGPMESLAELLLIQGVTKRLYEGEGAAPGLKDLLTVWESRYVNINTAPAPVLGALAWQVDPLQGNDFAAAVIAYRENPLHADALSKAGWYRTALPQFADITLPDAILTVASSHFTVTSTARVGSTTVERFACLERTRPETARSGNIGVTVLLQRVVEPPSGRQGARDGGH